MRLIDTHTHLVMGQYKGQLAPVLERSRQAGVDRWITIGTDLKDSAAGVAVCQEHEGLFCTVGVHPHEAAQVKAGYIEEMARLAESACAIGEIGLDYHYDNSPRKQQKQVFAELWELALEKDLPVVIHCRKGLEDCLSIMDQAGRRDTSVVFHCFTGNRAEARRLLDRGCFLSFTGVITFKDSKATQKAAQYAPADRIVLETDCPYLSPEPKRNVRPNEPALLVHIAEKLARLRGVNTEEIAQVTTENACKFFQLESE